LPAFGAVFIKFDAHAIFGFAARNIAAMFGVWLTVFVVLPLYAVYKDYKFTKIRSEPVYFKGEIFATRSLTLRF